MTDRCTSATDHDVPVSDGRMVAVLRTADFLGFGFIMCAPVYRGWTGIVITLSF